jgi:AraC family transcriptional regulator, ethanolamine operon transcriptional activator
MTRTQATVDNWTPQISVKSVVLTEFDSANLAHVVAGAELEHQRLPGGGTKMNLLQCALPHSVINRGAYSPAVLVNGTFASHTITIGMMLRQETPTILNGSNVKMGTLQIYSENSEMCYRAWPNATWFALVVSRERLLEFCLEHFGCAPRLPNSGIVTVKPNPEAAGSDLLPRLRDLDRSLPHFGALPNAARLGKSVENDVLLRIGKAMGTKPSVQNVSEQRRLRLCREILKETMERVEEDLDEMLDLQSMAKSTGLAPRTLQRTFQAEYGLCPQEWFRLERLNRVREDLLRARKGASITQVATRWGFFHLSRFSQYYRELFGERPSETLGRHLSV